MRAHWFLGTRESLHVDYTRSGAADHHVLMSPSFGSSSKSSSVCTVSIMMLSFGEQDACEGRVCFRANRKSHRHYKVSIQDVSIQQRTSLRRFATADRRSEASADPTFEEWDLQDEALNLELSSYRGLVLDVSYRPINVVCWRRALCLEILDKADVLEYYDYVINSPSRAFPIPAVLRITDYTHAPKRSKVKLLLNRKNIFLRDKFRCQYCDARERLTVDHVVPISRGGGWSWKNLVTACAKCNSKKGDKTLEEANMQLLKVPQEPKALDGRDMAATPALRTIHSSKSMPVKWLDYLPKHIFNPLKAFD